MTDEHVCALRHGIFNLSHTCHVLAASGILMVAVVEHSENVECGALGRPFAGINVGIEVLCSFGIVVVVIAALANHTVHFT